MTLTDEEIQRGLELLKPVHGQGGQTMEATRRLSQRERERSRWMEDHGKELLSELQRLRRIEEAADEFVHKTRHDESCNYQISLYARDTCRCGLIQRRAAYRAAKDGEA